jgi:hypothetical protein
MSFTSALKKASVTVSVPSGTYKCSFHGFEWVHSKSSSAVGYKLIYEVFYKGVNRKVNEVFWLKDKKGVLSQISFSILKRRLNDFGQNVDTFKLPDSDNDTGSFTQMIENKPSTILNLTAIEDGGYTNYKFSYAKLDKGSSSESEMEEEKKEEKKKRAYNRKSKISAAPPGQEE